MEHFESVVPLAKGFIKEIFAIIETGKFIDGEKQFNSSKEEFVGGMSLLEKALHTLCEKKSVYYKKAKNLLESNFSRLIPHVYGEVKWNVRRGYEITYHR